jgi:hypothetical protein
MSSDPDVPRQRRVLPAGGRCRIESAAVARDGLAHRCVSPGGCRDGLATGTARRTRCYRRSLSRKGGGVNRNAFTDDHETFRHAVRTFVTRELESRHEEIIKQRGIDRDVRLAAGSQGLLGLGIPGSCGAAKLHDFRFNAVLTEELAGCSLAFASSFGIHTDLGAPYLVGRRSEGQVVERRGAEPGARRVPATAPRLRLHERVPRRARVDRRTRHQNLGWHERDHARTHRQEPRAVTASIATTDPATTGAPDV